MTRKEKFLDKLVKAQKKGWNPKDPHLITKLECLNEKEFEKALDMALDKEDEDSKKKA